MGRVTITLHIDYPDGAEVALGSPQTPPDLEDAPWPSEPAPAALPPFPVALAAPGGTCPVHRLPWKVVPAGISKAGVAYSSFVACPERGCKEKPH